MAWTELTRRRYERKSDGYSSDVTDMEWAVIVLFLPDRNRLGRPRQVDLRWVWDAIQYLAATGCAWSLLPHDFPPISTVRYYFYLWRDDGLLSEINRKLVFLARQAAGRERPPTAGVIDSQSVKTTESGGICGYDAPLGECMHSPVGSGKADQGAQAPYHDGHLRPSDCGQGPCGQYSGP